MVLTSFTAKVPKRWRLFTFAVILVLILGQLFILTFSKPNIIPKTIIPEQHHQQQNKENTIQQPLTPPPSPASIPLPPPEKQSILHGFGGFFSKLPKMQHNFSPEPKSFTRLRETRRNAIKKSFLHGWEGYSK